MNDVHEPRDTRKIRRRGKCGVAAAHDRDGFTLEKRAVAQRAIADAASEQFLLAVRAEFFMLAARRNDNGARGVISLVGGHAHSVAVACDGNHRFALKARTERFGLVEQIGRKLRAGDRAYSGVVFNDRRIHYLTAERLALYHERFFICPASVNGSA